MLKWFYGRVAVKDGEAKKDGGDGDAGGFPAVENVFLIFGGATVCNTLKIPSLKYYSNKWLGLKFP
jgi:hypothetical protein